MLEKNSPKFLRKNIDEYENSLKWRKQHETKDSIWADRRNKSKGSVQLCTNWQKWNKVHNFEM